MARYFITGGAGFIGSHLVDRLVAEGNEVTVYDNLASGSKENIEHHLGKEHFRFIEADLLDFSALEQAVKGHEIIWHLGANTDIPTGNRITDLDLNNCTIATRNVLEVMRHNSIDKILFASSATVYGDVPPVALGETFGPLLPISLYGAGKLAGEGLISAYCHLFGLKAWIFRFANVVGARMGHGVIFDFIQKLRRNPSELGDNVWPGNNLHDANDEHCCRGWLDEGEKPQVTTKVESMAKGAFHYQKYGQYTVSCSHWSDASYGYPSPSEYSLLSYD